MTAARIILAVLALCTTASSGCDRPPTVTAQSVDQRQASAAATPEPIIDSTFDDIQFEMDEAVSFNRSLLTPKIENLIGNRIRIRGYMFPTLKKNGLKQFILVRDNLECCFGPGAALFDCIVVQMNEGQTAEYSIRPIAVEGTFRFEEIIGPDGSHLAIYRLDGDAVE